MNNKAIMDKQLIISVHNEVGVLAKISSLISGGGINLIAVCGYTIDNRGFVVIVTEDNQKAKKILESKNYDVREEEVILVTLDNKPGALKEVTEKIAKVGVDLTLVYGSVVQKGKESRIVLVSEDNATALAAIRIK